MLLNSNLASSEKTVYYNYDTNERSFDVNLTTATYLVVVSQWYGALSSDGLYIIKANASGGNITTIKEANGASFSINNNELSVSITGVYIGVTIIKLSAVAQVV